MPTAKINLLILSLLLAGFEPAWALAHRSCKIPSRAYINFEGLPRADKPNLYWDRYSRYEDLFKSRGYSTSRGIPLKDGDLDGATVFTCLSEGYLFHRTYSCHASLALQLIQGEERVQLIQATGPVIKSDDYEFVIQTSLNEMLKLIPPCDRLN